MREIKEVEIKSAFRHECADISVECPNCKLLYKEYANSDDDWHIVECDRCGTKYKYRYNW